jgi:hypothetical protein
MVPVDSDRILRVPPYSGFPWYNNNIRVRDFHAFLCAFPDNFHFFVIIRIWVLQPRTCRNKSGLGSSPFDRHYSENRCFFLFLQVLRCFSSLRLPHPLRWYRAFSPVGCPIRSPPDHLMFANPRRFSQLTTSFFAPGSQGIPHTPFVTFSRSESLAVTDLPAGNP